MLFARHVFRETDTRRSGDRLTINGAAALGLAGKTGSIDVGKKADLILLKHPSYKFLPYNIGMNIVDTVIKDGILYMI